MSEEAPKKPAQTPEVLQRFEDVTNFDQLFVLLGKQEEVRYADSTLPGQSVAHKIMEVMNESRELQDKGRFVKYRGFIAQFEDLAIRKVLNKLLIMNDPVLVEVQRREDERKKREEEESFSIKKVVAQHVKNALGMAGRKQKDYIDARMQDAVRLEEQHKGYFDALQEGFLSARLLELVKFGTDKTEREILSSGPSSDAGQPDKKIETETKSELADVERQIKELENVMNFIGKELEEIRERLEIRKKETSQESERVVRMLEGNIELLELNPLKWIIEKRDRGKRTLESLDKLHPEYTAEELKERREYWIEEIGKLESMIVTLEKVLKTENKV